MATRDLSEEELNAVGAYFAPFVTEEQRAAFLSALTREAEKRILVMPSGADLDRYASEGAPLAPDPLVLHDPGIW